MATSPDSNSHSIDFLPALQDGEEVKSDEYSQPTLELSRTLEGWWLPERALCCDDPFVAVSGA
jgi:hypothetical protein